MPRRARKDLNTTYIHVMVQEINKEYIFENEKNLKKYLESIKSIKSEEQFELLAYCMMNDHAHFLFWVNKFNDFEKYMHKNNLKFAQDYNKEKNRCGVVFRNRYQVEPIYKINHLTNCIKYIHNNPVKANMVSKCSDYPFSSYMEYTNKTGVAKSERLKELFGDVENYLDIIDHSYDRIFIDYENQENIKDFIAARIVEFMKKYHCTLIDIFSKTNQLSNLLIFLNSECNINHKEIINYFDISKKTFYRKFQHLFQNNNHTAT